MKHPILPTVLLAAIALAARSEDGPENLPAKAPEKTDKAAAAQKARFGPYEVEVELRDHSKLRGALAKGGNFILETVFGTLKVPYEEMISLHCVSNASAPVDGQALAAATKDAASDDPAKRAAAQQLLEEAGKNSLDPLFEARAKSAGEAKTRIDNLLKKLLLQNPAANEDGDSIRALKMSASGKLKAATVALHSKFGEFNLILSDITAIRWLCRGTQKTVELEAETGLRDWIDTEVDSMAGEQLSILSTGQINLFSNCMSSPNGCQNWGSRPFLAGALIGRLGEDEPFLIGSGKSWTPNSSQRLYVKIFTNENMGQGNPSSGQYKLTISTGTMVDEKVP